MNGAQVLLETLKAHQVEHVFGVPGETTLPLYRAWHHYPDIRHVLARDERSASYMADAYARLAFKPGICEGPSPGVTHLLPGVVEAYKASVAMLVLTTDVPLELENRNVLTGCDQSSLFRGITKETLTVRSVREMSVILRRAFRSATTGRPGPVHVRLPMDVLESEGKEIGIHADTHYSRYPSHRLTPPTKEMQKAVEWLSASERPIIVCGQGVLYSQAWEEIRELAECLGIPVATTITGKGSIAETHPLSVGVIGSRGGTPFSNRVLAEADLVFYVGSNTDSVTTSDWTLPRITDQKQILHLDISEQEVGNTYPTALSLVGDAKATLQGMVQIVRETPTKKADRNAARIAGIQQERKAYVAHLKEKESDETDFVDPIAFVHRLQAALPTSHVILADPGVSAIYLSAFYPPGRAGRTLVFNYAMGALGYALPAAVGAHCARPDHCVVALTGDGSFGFCAAELETIARIGGNINVILFNNGCFGWIRAALRFTYDGRPFATDFLSPDYVAIAKAFGIEAHRVTQTSELQPALEQTLGSGHPTFIELNVRSEDERVPPVPSWVQKAKELGLPFDY
jgi:acetolactate synthase-1/2/3 large subunit